MKKYPIFIDHRTLESRLKEIENIVSLEIPTPNKSKLEYFEREDIINGIVVATFKNPENGRTYQILPGNRIYNSSLIYTLRTNKVIRNKSDLRGFANKKKYSIGEIYPNGTFCSEVSRYDSSKSIVQTTISCNFFENGDLFTFFSHNINSEPQKKEKKINRKSKIARF